jgi:hypothetical protein
VCGVIYVLLICRLLLLALLCCRAGQDADWVSPVRGRA